MEYKPLHSNFEQLQDEAIERVFDGQKAVEDIKDLMAREIDLWVQAILKEHVEEVEVQTWSGDNDCPVHVFFSAGDKQTETCIDMFSRRIPFTEILDGFDDWDDLGMNTEIEPESVRKLAGQIKAFADRLYQRADEIEKENAEWEQKWALNNPTSVEAKD